MRVWLLLALALICVNAQQTTTFLDQGIFPSLTTSALPLTVDYAFQVGSTSLTAYDGQYVGQTSGPAAVYSRVAANPSMYIVNGTATSPYVQSWAFSLSPAGTSPILTVQTALSLNYPPPFGWKYTSGSPSPTIAFLNPVAGDVFLATDASAIIIRWASCNIGVYPHLITISLVQGASVTPIATSIEDTGSFTWADTTPHTGAYTFKIQSVSIPSLVQTSGSFTLGSATATAYTTGLRYVDVNRFVAEDSVTFKEPTDLNRPDLYPFTRNVYGYRSQSLYTVAMLEEAGLKVNDAIGSLSFYMGWSVLGDLPNVIIAIGWTTDTVFASGKTFYASTIVHAAETIPQSRLQERNWLTLACDSNTPSCVFDGTHSLVVEISYYNQITQVSGQAVVKTVSSGSDYMTLAGFVGDGSSYPFSSYTFQSYYLWVPKLRITRLAAMSDARLCANPLSVQPIPTVYRVTGPQSSHPAYGFYYASFNQPSSDGVLSYQQYGVSSPWTLSRKSISSVRQWALSYGTNNIYTNAISSEIPPGLDSIWIDVTATPASLFAIAVPYLVSAPQGSFSEYGYTHNTTFTVPVRSLIGSRFVTVEHFVHQTFVPQFPGTLRFVAQASSITDAVPATVLNHVAISSLTNFTVAINPNPNAFLVYMYYSLCFRNSEFFNSFAFTPTFLIDQEVLLDTAQVSLSGIVQTTGLDSYSLTTLPYPAASPGQTSVVTVITRSVPKSDFISVTFTDKNFSTIGDGFGRPTLTTSSFVDTNNLAAINLPPISQFNLQFTVDPAFYVNSTETPYHLSLLDVESDLATRRYVSNLPVTVDTSTPRVFKGSWFQPLRSVTPSTVALSGTPFSAVYLNQRMQSLYLASDLLAAGLVAGSSITGIALNVLAPSAAQTITNIVVGYAFVNPSVTKYSSATYFPTSIVIGSNGNTAKLRNSQLMAGRFVPLNFDTGLAAVWDGVSGLVLEFSSSIQSASFGSFGTVLKPTSEMRSLLDYMDVWPAPWPYVLTSANQAISSVMSINILAGCTTASTCNSPYGSCNATTSLCQCAAGYYGSTCTTYCNAATTCSGKGQCSSTGSCLCRSGYFGAACASPAIQLLNAAFSVSQIVNSTLSARYSQWGSIATEVMTDSTAVDPFAVGGFGLLASTENRRLQSIYTAADLFNGGLMTTGISDVNVFNVSTSYTVSLGLVNTLSLRMMTFPTTSLPNFKISYAWVRQTALTAIINTTALIGPMTLQVGDPNIIRTDEGTLSFQLPTPLVWDGVSSLVLEVSAGGGGASLTNTAGGALATYPQAMLGRTLASSSNSKVVLTSSTASLDLSALPSWQGNSVPGGPGLSVVAYTNAPAFILHRFSATVPTISSISPVSASGAGGALLTITGTNLGVSLQDAQPPLIQITSTLWRPLCTPVALISTTSFTCKTLPISMYDPTIPSAWMGSPQSVVVRTSSSGSFLSNTNIVFTVSAPPVIQALVDGSGVAFSGGSVVGGDSIHVMGSNLGATASDLVSISIGSAACASNVWISSSHIVCITAASSCSPSCTGVVTVVTGLGGQSSSTLTFTFNAALNVYLSPTGNDNTCVRNSPQQPCQTLAGAAAKFSDTELHFVLQAGTYAAANVTFNGIGIQLEAAANLPVGSVVLNCQQSTCLSISASSNLVAASGISFINYGTGAIKIISASPRLTFNSFSVVSCTFTSAFSPSTAILISNSISVSVFNSTFTGGSTQSAGISSTASSLTVTNCTFSNLQSTNGAAIYSFLNKLISSVGSASVTSSTFTNNLATVRGGAIYSSGSSLSLANSAFVGNSANLLGGALALQNMLITIVGSSFSANTIAPSTENPIPDTLGGAAIYGEISNGDISNSSFVNNVVYGVGRGGAWKTIYCQLTGSNLNFVGNSAPSAGGGLSLETLSTVALTQPLTFISNNAGSFATLPPTSSKFFSSKIDFSFSYKPVVQNSTSIGVSTGLGGAVYAAFAQLVSFVGSAGSPVIISNNNANYGGGLYAKTSNSLVINNANISSNAAPLGGGGVVASQTPITMSSIVFAANSASTGSGGALLVDSQYLNPTLFAANGVTFTQNVAQFSPSFVSSPSSLSITYGNNSVTSIPGASSGPAFPIPLTATLLDSNGNVVQTESIAQVNMIVSAGGSISGTGSQTLVRGVTVFSTAGVVGTPGTTLTIAFQVTPISTGITLTSAPISVYLRLCRVGEAISASVCTVCTNSLYSLTLPAPQVCPMKCPPFSETNIDGSACVCSFGSQKGLLVRAEDGDLICVERMQLWEQGVLWALSAIMMVITLVMLVMVMYWRKKRTLHSSSPLFCAIVIFGGTLAAASMADSVVIRTPDNCFYAYWLLHLGFTTTFGALFTKTYRLSVIFNNAELRAVSIANSQLLVALGVLIAVDVGILSAWSFSGSFEVYPWSQIQCLNPRTDYYQGALIACKALMTLYGSLLTWKVRNVPTSFNESRHLGVTIYNMALLSLAYLIINYSLATALSAINNLRFEWAIKCVIIVITLSVIFGPKFRAIIFRNDMEDKYEKKAAAISKSGTLSSIENEVEGGAENSRFRGASMLMMSTDTGLTKEENQKLIDEKYRNLVRLLEGARKARDTAQQQIVLRTKSLEEAHRSADQAIDQITTFAYEIEYVKTLNPTPDDFLDQVIAGKASFTQGDSRRPTMARRSVASRRGSNEVEMSSINLDSKLDEIESNNIVVAPDVVVEVSEEKPADAAESFAMPEATSEAKPEASTEKKEDSSDSSSDDEDYGLVPSPRKPTAVTPAVEPVVESPPPLVQRQSSQFLSPTASAAPPPRSRRFNVPAGSGSSMSLLNSSNNDIGEATSILASPSVVGNGGFVTLKSSPLFSETIGQTPPSAPLSPVVQPPSDNLPPTISSLSTVTPAPTIARVGPKPNRQPPPPRRATSTLGAALSQPAAPAVVQPTASQSVAQPVPQAETPVSVPAPVAVPVYTRQVIDSSSDDD